MASLTTAVPQREIAAPRRRDLSQTIGATYAAVSSRVLLACAITALVPVVLRLALLHWYPVPLPAVHDEFSYLLGADTFASGRVVNPPHPLWRHFESFHIIQQPAYASKYAPMQALLLAAGQLFGMPFIGLLLSVAIMGWCFCWAMQGWLRPGAAFAGALLAAAHLGPYWSNTYWGGSVAAIGGALLAGAMPRLIARPRRGAAFALALGIVVLANSRPYEGAVMTFVTAAIIVVSAIRKRKARELLRVTAGPVLLTAAVAAAAMGYYNYRVTGNALLLPYELNEQQYAVYSNFLWARPRAVEPVYHNDLIRRYWTTLNGSVFNDARAHWPRRNLQNIALGFGLLLATAWIAIPILLTPLPRSIPLRWLTYPPLLAFALAMLPLEDFKPHYIGIIAALVFIRFMMTLHAVWKLRPGTIPVGPAVAIIIFELVFAQSLWLMNTNDPKLQRFARSRAEIEHRLETLPGGHVVLVRYNPDHMLHEEWVYNRANIDASPVVWARDLGPGGNLDLLRYYSMRKIWLLQPDRLGAVPQPYTAQLEQ